MKSIIKTLLFGMFLCVAVGVKAQEKYHFARVAINVVNDKAIVVITDNEPDKVIELDKGLSSTGKIKALLKVVNQMTAEGWIVMTVNSENVLFTYFLKKKAN
ncbi:MAG TPA: hypothetical protein VGB95_00815 [Chitinophagales bacterium]